MREAEGKALLEITGMAVIEILELIPDEDTAMWKPFAEAGAEITLALLRDRNAHPDDFTARMYFKRAALERIMKYTESRPEYTAVWQQGIDLIHARTLIESLQIDEAE